MNDSTHTSDRTISRKAMAIAIGIHVLAGIVALVLYLEEPEKDHSAGPISVEIEAPQAVIPQALAPSAQARGMQARGTRSAPSSPRAPLPQIPAPTETTMLTDLPLTTESVPDIRARISSDLLQSISQEDAFDSLMVLLEEFPQFKETILRKMVAGKGIDRIPDLYVSTGIQDIHSKMKFASKHEYELMRQQFMYGAYQDPVHGPWGYKKTGPMVNVIELLGWLVGLIEGK